MTQDTIAPLLTRLPESYATRREAESHLTAPGALPVSQLTFPDSEPLGIEAFHALDRTREALLGQLTGGLSPAALSMAFFDWALHLGFAQGKQSELIWKAARKLARFQAHAWESIVDTSPAPCIEPLPGDRRFTAPAWKTTPYDLVAQAFLLQQQWWHNVTHEVPGVTPHHEQVVSFVIRQWLDVFSPSNIPWLNPEVLTKIQETGGANLIAGSRNFQADLARLISHAPAPSTDAFQVGVDVAVTPGKVILRNHLIELIQYLPTTQAVHREPILITPAWIMKYYVLDLTPETSLIRYLVAQGFTVFCISWRNPDRKDRDLGLDDYRKRGVMAALNAINTIMPEAKVHAVGYCLGGTLLSVAAAAMAQAGENRLASISLLAAQTDFSEPGELALFIDHSQTHYLESVMWNRGTLEAQQMAGAFALLRSNDLIWSRMVHAYLLGEQPVMTALDAWNADATRLPYRMHAEYLRNFYLDNALANGKLVIDDRPATMQSIRVPTFAVGTETDHVAPWTSVFKILHLADADVTFVLTSGGHNVGIVNPPENSKRH